MPAIPLGISARRRQQRAPARLFNMLLERSPENLEDQVAMIPRPGLVEFSDIGATPIRGLARQEGVFSGDYIVVEGTTAYRVTASGAETSLGTVAGSGSVEIAIGAGSALICNGTNLYSTTGSSLSTVSFPDSAGVVSLAFVNGYYLAVRANSQRVYFSGVGALTFGGLDYLPAENSADNLESVRVIGDEVWLLGKSSIEVHVPTGDADLPFIRVNGRLFGYGTASRDTVARLDTSLLWVGGEVRTVFRTAPQPTRIADDNIDERLRLANVADLHGFAFSMEGHALYVLNMGAQGTWAYDVSTEQWSEFGSYGLTGFRAKWSAPCGDGRFITGDSVTGKLWRLDPAVNTDAGGVLSRRVSGRLQMAGPPARCDNLVMRCNVGAAPLDTDPMAQLRVSDDEGKTFLDHGLKSLGRQGDYRERVAWTRLGLMGARGSNSRIFEVEVTDDVFWSLESLRYNESLR